MPGFGCPFAKKVRAGNAIIKPNLLLISHEYYCYLLSCCFAASKYFMPLKLYFLMNVACDVHGAGRNTNLPRSSRNITGFTTPGGSCTSSSPTLSIHPEPLSKLA